MCRFGRIVSEFGLIDRRVDVSRGANSLSSPYLRFLGSVYEALLTPQKEAQMESLRNLQIEVDSFDIVEFLNSLRDFMEITETVPKHFREFDSLVASIANGDSSSFDALAPIHRHVFFRKVLDTALISYPALSPRGAFGFLRRERGKLPALEVSVGELREAPVIESFVFLVDSASQPCEDVATLAPWLRRPVLSAAWPEVAEANARIGEISGVTGALDPDLVSGESKVVAVLLWNLRLMWRFPFTRRAPVTFDVDGGGSVVVMLTADCRGVKVLSGSSRAVALPVASSPLELVVATGWLNGALLAEFDAHATVRDGRVAIPRFSIEAESRLVPTRASGSDVTELVEHVEFSLCEEGNFGTDAASAVGDIGKVMFAADRPFSMVLRDSVTKAVLLQGFVSVPEQFDLDEAPLAQPPRALAAAFSAPAGARRRPAGKRRIIPRDQPAEYIAPITFDSARGAAAAAAAEQANASWLEGVEGEDSADIAETWVWRAVNLRRAVPVGPVGVTDAFRRRKLAGYQRAWALQRQRISRRRLPSRVDEPEAAEE